MPRSVGCCIGGLRACEAAIGEAAFRYAPQLVEWLHVQGDKSLDDLVKRDDPSKNHRDVFNAPQ